MEQVLIMIPAPPLHLDDQKIDSDHETTIQFVRALAEAINRSASNEEIVKRTNDLVEHMRAHFRYEEDLMDIYGYPEKETHRGEHNDISLMVSKMLVDLPNKETFHGTSRTDAIWNRLLDHIQSTDKKFVEFLTAARGPSRA